MIYNVNKIAILKAEKYLTLEILREAEKSAAEGLNHFELSIQNKYVYIFNERFEHICSKVEHESDGEIVFVKREFHERRPETFLFENRFFIREMERDIAYFQDKHITLKELVKKIVYHVSNKDYYKTHDLRSILHLLLDPNKTILSKINDKKDYCYFYFIKSVASDHRQVPEMIFISNDTAKIKLGVVNAKSLESLIGYAIASLEEIQRIRRL